MAGSHALFSPSSADRISTCPASLLHTQGLPDSPSFEAVEGTVAHALHEMCLTQGFVAETFIGVAANVLMPTDALSPAEWALIPDLLVSAEMAAAVQESVDWCRAVPGRHFVEQRLSIDPWTPVPQQFGTSDFVAVDYASRTLTIVDLKYGRGVRVNAFENAQLMLYALGALNEFEMFGDLDIVSIRVSQPRLDHRDEWITSAAELLAHGERLKARFALALNPDAPFYPADKACKFCKAKATCPALYARTLELANGMFDNLNETASPVIDGTWPISAHDAKKLAPEHLAKALEAAPLVRGFLDAVESHAMALLLHGQDVSGYKLVEGRSFRRWADVDAARILLTEHGIDFFKDPEPISPADAEKKLPKAERARLAPLVSKPAGKPTLAPVSDKRPAFTPATASEMFADLAGSSL
jgi:hypothetical protein